MLRAKKKGDAHNCYIEDSLVVCGQNKIKLDELGKFSCSIICNYK